MIIVKTGDEVMIEMGDSLYFRGTHAELVEKLGKPKSRRNNSPSFKVSRRIALFKYMVEHGKYVNGTKAPRDKIETTKVALLESIRELMPHERGKFAGFMKEFG